MTSSGTSTSAGQFFLLLSMVGAIAAVAFARDTHPVALLLLSGAVVSAGLVGLAFHRVLSAFFAGDAAPSAPISSRARENSDLVGVEVRRDQRVHRLLGAPGIMKHGVCGSVHGVLDGEIGARWRHPPGRFGRQRREITLQWPCHFAAPRIPGTSFGSFRIGCRNPPIRGGPSARSAV